MGSDFFFFFLKKNKRTQFQFGQNPTRTVFGGVFVHSFQECHLSMAQWTPLCKLFSKTSIILSTSASRIT